MSSKKNQFSIQTKSKALAGVVTLAWTSQALAQETQPNVEAPSAAEVPAAAPTSTFPIARSTTLGGDSVSEFVYQPPRSAFLQYNYLASTIEIDSKVATLEQKIKREVKQNQSQIVLGGTYKTDVGPVLGLEIDYKTGETKTESETVTKVTTKDKGSILRLGFGAAIPFGNGLAAGARLNFLKETLKEQGADEISVNVIIPELGLGYSNGDLFVDACLTLSAESDDETDKKDKDGNVVDKSDVKINEEVTFSLKASFKLASSLQAGAQVIYEDLKKEDGDYKSPSASDKMAYVLFAGLQLNDDVRALPFVAYQSQQHSSVKATTIGTGIEVPWDSRSFGILAPLVAANWSDGKIQDKTNVFSGTAKGTEYKIGLSYKRAF